ncbi:MAG: hypothetical protein PHH11_08615 [Methylomonas sp.]|nr:hypothetical protein [Methylomonas sp.]
MSDDSRLILYKLKFDDGHTIEFPIHLDKATNDFLAVLPEPAPSWIALECHQCSNCPLSTLSVPRCPVAANLLPLIELCGAMVSYQSVHMDVYTPERCISANTTAQRVLSSILGLVIATSPCPHTEHFKPMARFHLPLASEDETIYRTSSMYLLAQHFLYKDGKAYSLDLDGLRKIYAEMQVINRALANRLRTAISQDAAVNGIILLDLLTQSVTWSIEDGLDNLRYLFKPYGVGAN